MTKIPPIGPKARAELKAAGLSFSRAAEAFARALDVHAAPIMRRTQGLASQQWPLHPLLKQLALTTPWSMMDWHRVILDVIERDAWRRERHDPTARAAAKLRLIDHVAGMSPETFDPWIAAEIGIRQPFVGTALALYLELVDLA